MPSTDEQLPISVLIQTKNEEASIVECIRSLGAFGEVVTVDSNSEDRTVELAERAGSSVVPFTWDGRYPKKKQWQLDHLPTRYDWILFLDADERVTPHMVAELRAMPQETFDRHAAFDLLLDYKFGGQFLKHGHRVRKRVLLDRRRVRFLPVDDIASSAMGELEGHYQPVADGPVSTLQARLLHMDLDPVRTWFERHNRYSDWEAYLRTHPDVRDGVAQMRTDQGRRFDRVPGKPALFFLYAYLAKAGFLDGRAGFDYAMALSMYYWQIGVKERERRREVTAP